MRLWGNESMFLYLTGAGFSICVEMLDELTVSLAVMASAECGPQIAVEVISLWPKC